jgi:malonate transporter
VIILLDIVAPIFGLVLAGTLMARTPLLTQEGVRGIGNFVYYAAIPALLFRTMASAHTPVGSDLALIATYLLSCTLVFAASLMSGRALFRDALGERAVMAMGAAFSNSVQLGIPLVLQAFGEAGLVQLMLIVSFHSALLITLSTVVIESAREGGHPGRSLGLAVRAIVTNPVILAIIAGLVVAAAGWKLPGPVDRFVALLAGASASCALFSMGASMAQYRLGGNLGESAVTAVFKLAALPATAWLLGRYLFALAPLPLAVATICAGLPSGVNVFILAQRYGLAVERSVNLIVLSTLASLATLWLLLTLLVPR